MKTRKEIILDTITDLVSDFLYYDRKDDDDLPRGAIQTAMSAGEITAQEILDHFASEMERQGQ